MANNYKKYRSVDRDAVSQRICAAAKVWFFYCVHIMYRCIMMLFLQPGQFGLDE